MCVCVDASAVANTCMQDMFAALKPGGFEGCQTGHYNSSWQSEGERVNNLNTSVYQGQGWLKPA